MLNVHNFVNFIFWVVNSEPVDVGVVIEGVKLLHHLKSISFGLVMLFGLIYALNLSYPQSLKFTFEFFQKVLMNLDGSKLSPKVQALKIKMFQWIGHSLFAYMFPTTGGTLKHFRQECPDIYIITNWWLTPAREHFPASCNSETFDTGEVTHITIESRKSTFSSSIETVLGYVSSSLLCYCTFSFFMFCWNSASESWHRVQQKYNATYSTTQTKVWHCWRHGWGDL